MKIAPYNEAKPELGEFTLSNPLPPHLYRKGVIQNLTPVEIDVAVGIERGICVIRVDSKQMYDAMAALTKIRREFKEAIALAPGGTWPLIEMFLAEIEGAFPKQAAKGGDA